MAFAPLLSPAPKPPRRANRASSATRTTRAATSATSLNNPLTWDDGSPPAGLRYLAPRRKRVILRRGWANPTGEVIRKVAHDLYVIERTYDFIGIDVGGKAVVVRLPNGSLLVHSPLALTSAVADALAQLGTVGYIVTANTEHCDFAREWIEAYPDARALACPTLAEKRPDIPYTASLTDTPEDGYADVLDQCYLKSAPFFHEVVFFHKPTGTFIATDFYWNWPGLEETSLRTAAFKLAMDTVYRPIYSKILVRNATLHTAELDKIQSWPAQMLLPCHGDLVEKNAQQVLRQFLGRN